MLELIGLMVGGYLLTALLAFIMGREGESRQHVVVRGFGVAAFILILACMVIIFINGVEAWL